MRPGVWSKEMTQQVEALTLSAWHPTFDSQNLVKGQMQTKVHICNPSTPTSRQEETDQNNKKKTWSKLQTASVETREMLTQQGQGEKIVL